MQELADSLGISRTTVSLVLKGNGDKYRISRKTQEKILNLVEEENYKPNYFAQALNRNVTKTVGIIFPDIFEEFMVKMVRGIEDILAPRDYSMILMTSRFKLSQEQKNLEELLYRGSDGILLVPTCHYNGEEEDRSHLNSFNRSYSNLVMIDRKPPDWDGPYVVQNDRAGGVYAARFLQNVGCSDFLAVSLDLSASSISSRLSGFSEILPGAERILLKNQNPGSSDLVDALKLHLSRLSPGQQNPLGIFVTTAGLALRVNEILQMHGYTLNREYRIIRFGSDPRGYTSGMASIPQPHYEMGREAALLMLNLLEKQGETGNRDCRTEICLDLPL